MRSDFRKNLANIIPWSPAPQRSDSGESDQKSHCALLLRNPGMGIQQTGASFGVTVKPDVRRT